MAGSRPAWVAPIAVFTLVVLVAAAEAALDAETSTQQHVRNLKLTPDISAAAPAASAAPTAADVLAGQPATATSPVASPIGGGESSILQVRPAAVDANAATIWKADDLAAVYSPTYTLRGCYNDNASLYAPRRLARRLAVSTALTEKECARRAVAFGYPYFGITWFEDDPKQGYACWGAHDFTLATGGGPATQNGKPVCGVECPVGNKPSCGKAFTFNLYQVTSPILVAEDTGIGGQWSAMLELPVAGVYATQVVGKDEIFFIEFIQGSHPAIWNRTYNMATWVRSSNTWKAAYYLNTRKDLGCGWNIRQPDGELAGFSGHTGSPGFAGDLQDTRLYQRHRGDVVGFKNRLPWGRWYGTSVVLPDGRLYVVGGTAVWRGGGVKGPSGAEIWDPATRSWLGRQNIRNKEIGAFPVNSVLASGSLSNTYYPGLTILPDGSLLFSNCKELQTINYLTGATIAQAPTLPYKTCWEYPVSAPVVTLQMPTYEAGKEWSVEWIAFGGGWDQGTYATAKDFAVRIRLTLDGSTPPKHTFSSNWTVETMPGPRVMADGVLLPNGKIVILNGNEMGGGKLPLGTSNYHVNEAWIYNPDAPAGQRFKRTASYSNIYRSYHSAAILTAQGDVVVSGSSVVRKFRFYTQRPYSVPPYSNSEYRVETFTPHYILGSRPSWGTTPTIITYSTTFPATVAAGAATVKRVVLVEPGGATHSSQVGYRNQILAYSGAGTPTLTVNAPANTFEAPPGFYLLFLVADDDSYSVGRWVQLRGPFSDPPLTLRTTSTSAVAAATSQFENGNNPFQVAAGTATLTVAAAAAGSGLLGLVVTPTTQTVTLTTTSNFTIAGGARVHTHLWARTAAAGVKVSVSIGNTNNAPITSRTWDAAAQTGGSVSAQYEHFPLGGLVPGQGTFRLLITLSALTADTPVHLDDIETWVIGGDAVAAAVSPSPAARARAAVVATAAAAMSTSNNMKAVPSYFGDPDITSTGDNDFKYAPGLQGAPKPNIADYHPGIPGAPI